MKSSLNLEAYGSYKNTLLLWGILLVVLGCVAISATTMTTILSVLFLGAVIFISGLVITVDAFTFWRRSGSGFIWHLLMGILTLVVGFMLIKSPLLGSISLTLFLGVFYLVLGCFRVGFSLVVQPPRWGWNLFSGLVSVLLGVLILASWPVSGLFIIGLFIGIDLLFSGWAYIMASLAARSILNNK